MIEQGKGVVIDSTCSCEDTLEQGMMLAEKWGLKYVYVECRVEDAGVLERRLRERVPLRSQRGWVDSEVGAEAATNGVISLNSDEDFSATFKRWMENACRPDDGGIVVDSTKSPEECVVYVLRRMGISACDDLGSAGLSNCH